MKLNEVASDSPMIASMLRILLSKRRLVKARVAVSTSSGDEKGNAEVLSVDDDGWAFWIRDLIDDDASLAPLKVEFQKGDDSELELKKTDYGYLLRYKDGKRYIEV